MLKWNMITGGLGFGFMLQNPTRIRIYDNFIPHTSAYKRN